MTKHDPMERRNPKKASATNTCSATNRSGQPCRKTSIPGGTVCRNHGGAAPQVRDKARQRLLEALDPAAAELVRIAKGEGTVPTVTKDGVVDMPPNFAVRVKAIEAIMDRAGLPKRQEVTGSDGAPVAVVVRDVIAKRLGLQEDDGDGAGD